MHILYIIRYENLENANFQNFRSFIDWQFLYSLFRIIKRVQFIWHWFSCVKLFINPIILLYLYIYWRSKQGGKSPLKSLGYSLYFSGPVHTGEEFPQWFWFARDETVVVYAQSKSLINWWAKSWMIYHNYPSSLYICPALTFNVMVVAHWLWCHLQTQFCILLKLLARVKRNL